MFTLEEIQKAIDEIAAKAMTANAAILAKMLQEYFALLGRMYANLSKGSELTWTELNAYNRFNKYLKEFDKVTSSSFAKIVNKIKETREAVYVEAYAKDSYNTQIQASDDMGFSLPSKQVINQILDNRIEKMKLDNVMNKHRKEIVKKIQISITTGIEQGEGYPQIAKRLQQEVDFTRKKANLVTRTEIGRSRSLANEKVYEQANKYVKTTKIWLATLDNRTRHDHRILDLQHADDKGYFHVRGLKAKAPRLFGVAHEDINCRCTTVLTPAVSRRARDYDNIDYQKKLAKRIDDLMARGLTEKQAEKRANSEIKPPSKIVKWQSYDEWNSSLLVQNQEKEASHRRINRSTQINKRFIESAEYRKKFDKLGEDKELTRAIYNSAKKMLYHRNGKKFEDLVFIHSDTKEMYSRTDYDVDSQVIASNRMRKFCLNNPGKIISIHNHPGNSVPSLTDLNGAFSREYNYGLIACHDGTIYKYKPFKKILYEDYRLLIVNLEKRGYNKKSIQQFIEDLKKLGVEMEEL